MSLNIVLGKPKTGKSSYIYEKIKEDINNKKDVILFVPSQLRQETENKYMEVLKEDGIIGVNITTISEYIKDCIVRLGLYSDEKYVSKLDKQIILADVVSKVKNNLHVFKNVSKKEGFLQLIYIYIDLLRKSNFNVNDIDSVKLDNSLIEEKLNEICKIYEYYLNEINDKYVDNVDEINIFLQNISKINLNNTSIYIDSYNNFTENEFEIIKEFLLKGINITVSLTTDITRIEDVYSNNSNDIFETSNDTYTRLLSIANSVGVSVENKVLYIKRLKQSSDIEYLSENIFMQNKVNKIDAKNIYINLYNNSFSEITYISNVINKKVREGYRYSDFDIYTTDIEKYKDIVSRIFFDTKIPVYINSKTNIMFSKLVLYITKYLEILEKGVKKDLLLDILKIGFLDFAPSDIYEFENYILEFNINDYYITRPFKLNNTKSQDHIYDLDSLNSIKEKLIGMYDKKIIPTDYAKEYISNIYEHLKDNCIFEKYSNYILNLENNAESFDITNIEKEKQVWDKICEIFNSISKIYKEKISFSKFKEVFNIELKETFIKSAPPVKDAVSLVDINLAKMKETKIAFFVGVNEGSFPKIVEEDILFSDEQLNKLKSSNITLKETTLSKQNMAMYNIYSALNGITEKLYILVPTSDYSGKSLRISEFINEIKKVLNIKVKGNITESKEGNVNLEDIYTKNELFEYLLNNLEAKNKNDINYIVKYLEQDDMYKELLNYTKNDDNLNEETLKLLYNDKLNTSVSKLELFKKCPFSYYMKYILKIEPRREFEISSLDIGSFMHEVLEEFSKYLFKNNISWQSLLIDNSFEDILNEIIEKKLESSIGNKKQSIKFVILKEKLVNTMKKVVIVIANSFNQSDFVPYGYEIEFKDGKAFAPIKIDLGNDKEMNIIGKIDRVDVLKLEDEMYVRIVDYKSSSKDLKLEDIKEGLSLQLITYLSDFINNLKVKDSTFNIKPAAMLYFNLSNKLVNLKDYINDTEKVKKETIKALRMKGIFLKDLKVIEKMDKNISNETRLIDITKTTLNKDKTNKVLKENEFEELFKETKSILKSLGSEIMSGVVKINPNKKADYCRFCNYSSICRKNSCI